MTSRPRHPYYRRPSRRQPRRVHSLEENTRLPVGSGGGFSPVRSRAARKCLIGPAAALRKSCGVPLHWEGCVSLRFAQSSKYLVSLPFQSARCSSLNTRNQVCLIPLVHRGSRSHRHRIGLAAARNNWMATIPPTKGRPHRPSVHRRSRKWAAVFVARDRLTRAQLSAVPFLIGAAVAGPREVRLYSRRDGCPVALPPGCERTHTPISTRG